MTRRGRAIRTIWAVCLLLAGLNHARILAQHGLGWDYGGVNWASALYWSGLTIVDPLAAVLLFVRPRAGVPLTIGIITTNVAHNLVVTGLPSRAGDLLADVTASWTLVSQIGFMLFVVATARTAWRIE